jgi:leucyl-tRNA synthetase
VNGKLRAVVRLLPGAGSEAMQQAALAESRVQTAIAGKQVVKVVVVPNKLINIVVK